MRFRWLFIPWLALFSLTALPSFAQWQQVGQDQLPDPAGFDKVRAKSASGLRLEDDTGTLGVFIEDGGQVGIGTTSPVAPLDVQGGIHIPAGQALLYNLYYQSGWRYTADGIGAYLMASSSDGRFSFVSAGAGTAGNLAGVNERFSILTNATLRLGNDTGLQIVPQTSLNQFQFGTSTTPDRVTLDTDDGSLAGMGGLDFEGGAMFGSSGDTMTVFQPACEFQSTDAVTYDALSDSVHPSATPDAVLVSFPCPWATPGTRIDSVRVIATLTDSSDSINFAIKKQSSSGALAFADLVAFGGSDYTKSSGMTLQSGDIYTRSADVSITLGEGERVWAAVELSSAETPEDCTLHGLVWTFEERAY